MATQRAMKCNLFRLGITPREDTIRLTRRTPRSNGRGARGEGSWMRAPRELVIRAMGMRRNGRCTAGPPCSIPTERDRRTMSHLNLLSAPYSPYPVAFLATTLAVSRSTNRRTPPRRIGPVRESPLEGAHSFTVIIVRKLTVQSTLVSPFTTECVPIQSPGFRGYVDTCELSCNREIDERVW